jgi:hypothetical protein
VNTNKINTHKVTRGGVVIYVGNKEKCESRFEKISKNKKEASSVDKLSPNEYAFFNEEPLNVYYENK